MKSRLPPPQIYLQNMPPLIALHSCAQITIYALPLSINLPGTFLCRIHVHNEAMIRCRQSRMTRRPAEVSGTYSAVFPT
jgi:hypothetical protein